MDMQGQFPQKIVLGHDPIQVLHLGLNPLPAQKSCTEILTGIRNLRLHLNPLKHLPLYLNDIGYIFKWQFWQNLKIKLLCHGNWNSKNTERPTVFTFFCVYAKLISLTTDLDMFASAQKTLPSVAWVHLRSSFQPDLSSAGLHKLCHPASLAVRKWRENAEEMEREWGNGEWFTLNIPHFVSISSLSIHFLYKKLSHSVAKF